MSQVHLRYEDAVAILTVDSPEVHNGLTPEMGHRLVELCDEIDGRLDIAAAVITGANGTFCSGADRRRWDVDADQSSDHMFKNMGAVYQAFMRVGRLQVPTIAAVEGAAVGAGMNLMMATDMRIVAEDAKLLSGFLRIGLHPGGGFLTLLGRLGGREATAAMAMFGERIDGRRAVELGMAWEALPAPEVLPRAIELAKRAGDDPELTRQALRSMRQELAAPGMAWEAATEFERATQMWSMRRRDEN